MKIVMPGGSGQVGTVLARAFVRDGHEVVVLSRHPTQAVAGEDGHNPSPRPTSRSGRVRAQAWDGRTLGGWASEIDGADLVVNLAGRSVNCRYTAANRTAIVSSRVDSTRVVGEAIARAVKPPRVWLQASTATIYAHRYDAANDEASGVIGGGEPGVSETWRFSIDVVKAWEEALDQAQVPGTRKVKLRSAMVMNPDPGSIFDVLLRLVRFGLGGVAGDGRQYVSWIHHADFSRALNWIVDHDGLTDVVNVAAPNPVPYREFIGALRQAWGAPIGLPANRLMLEMGAFIMRSETELVLKSRRVVPARLLDSGFRFDLPDWAAAARQLTGEWRQLKVSAS